MNEQKLKNIVEAALLAAGCPVSIDQLMALFVDEEPTKEEIRNALNQLREDYQEKALEIKEVSSGFRMQVKEDYSIWVSRLWTERPTRYSRALLETLALIAYRQPITRGDIEDIRGVSVSSSIMKTLQEREWVKVVGHRDVPGKPAMYASTKTFLDYFNLKTLDELPTLAEIRDIDSINAEFDLGLPEMEETKSSNPDNDEENNSIENETAKEGLTLVTSVPNEQEETAQAAPATEH